MRIITLLILLLPTVAAAQYKCTVNGKSQYSDVPCAADARFVGAMEDRVSERSRLEAEVLRRREKVQRNSIERRENESFRAQQRVIEHQVASENAQAAANEQNRRSRCSNLEYEINRNQQGISRYQSFGWQASLTQQEVELKRNRESYDRECR